MNIENINTIIQDDCLNIMRTLPDKAIDLIITDPPYGIGESLNNNKTRSKLADSKDYGIKDWG